MTPGPEHSSTSRRAFLALLGVAPLAVSACSAEKKGAVEVHPSDDGFPKTVAHRFGSTELKAPPSRIVALGSVEAETLVALGLVPLARPGADSTPWFRSGLRALPAAEAPHLYDDSRQLAPSVFNEVGPDAFISLGNRLSQQEYEALSAVAPVIVAPESVNAEDWKEATEFVAGVVGLQDSAGQLIAEAEMEISESIADYPVLRGSTALLVSASSASGSDLVLADPDSAPALFFASLGLAAPAGLARLSAGLAKTPARFPAGSRYLPRTRAGELSADALVVNVPANDFKMYKALKALSREFPQFGPGTVYVVSGDESLALQRQSILGAQWSARNIVPELAKAAYKSKNG
jgi:iron complex transport system substrate-binding protein